MSDYDSPWKEALAEFFQEFLAFYFPQAPADIDWERGHETLDKELQQALRDAESGRRVVDHLVKVWLKDGREEWLLIHVEIQAQADPDFLGRLYACNYRIFDRYQRSVVTFVILADDRPGWMPTVYEFSLWGFHVRMEFPAVKLLTLAARRDDLETDLNPFAALTLAHVRTQETRGDAEARRAWKFRLVKSLYRRGLSADSVRKLFRCIDWMMDHPAQAESLFWDDVIQFEKENHMPFIDIATRKGIEIGMEKGIERGLVESILLDWEIRFGAVDESARAELEAVHSIEQLRKIARASKTDASLDELRRLCQQL